MAGVTVYSRTGSSLLRVVAAAGNAEAEARKMSYGHPFCVEVAAQVANVEKEALDAALARGAVGEGWYEASLTDVFAALARTSRGEKRQAQATNESTAKKAPRKNGQSESTATAPRKNGQSESTATAPSKDSEGESTATAPPQSGEGEAAAPEDASPEAVLGEWQAWLKPCCPASAPKAKDVKAILRSRGAPLWLYGICKEISQKGAAGKYRKILKIGRQAVAAAV